MKRPANRPAVLVNRRVSIAPFVEFQRRLDAAVQPLLDTLNHYGSQFVEFHRKIVQVLRLLSALAEAVERAIPKELPRLLYRIAQNAQNSMMLEETGWVVHYSTPFEHIDDCAGDAEAIHDLLCQHYREQWPKVRQDIESRLMRYDIDTEAKEAFHEALQAHEVGLYRCVCRVLIPEIERVTRAELHDNKMVRITSQPRLLKLVGESPLPWTGLPGFYDLSPYHWLSNHLYVSVKNDESRKQLAQDPVPNRHAAVHGLVVYSSMQNSLNTIFLVDHIFFFISELKRCNFKHILVQ